MSVNTLPTNNLIESLIKSLRNSTAACPTCKKVKVLSVCEHCSNVYCHDCRKEHLKRNIANLHRKLEKLQEYPTNLKKLKDDIDNSERESLEEMSQKLTAFQNEVISVIQTRKQVLFDQIKRFYSEKEK